MNEVQHITTFSQLKPDDIFITSVSYEERCLAVSQMLSDNFKCKHAIVFIIEPQNEKTGQNLKKIESIFLKHADKLDKIPILSNNHVSAIVDLCQLIVEQSNDNSIILDITTIPTKVLLSLLKTIEDVKLWNNIRIFYTEPKNYKTDLYLPMSIGIGNITTIAEFISSESPSLPIFLIAFLGYEGDRAKAIFDQVEPDETRLIIPYPAYQPRWEGKTERLNQTLLKIVGDSKKIRVSAIDPLKIVENLEDLKKQFSFENFKWIITPLGTKPQTVGIYLFWKKYPDSFSILFADSLLDNPTYRTVEIGKTWLLLEQ